MPKPTLPQAAVVIALCALLATVVLGFRPEWLSTSGKTLPVTEIVVKITEKGGQPVTGVVVRGPSGTDRPGDSRGIFHLPFNWSGQRIIVEDEASGKTVLTVTIPAQINGMLELVIP